MLDARLRKRSAVLVVWGDWPRCEARLSLEEALQLATSALAGPDRELKAPDLEVAVLSQSNGRRAFRRVADVELAGLLGQPADQQPSGGTPD